MAIEIRDDETKLNVPVLSFRVPSSFPDAAGDFFIFGDSPKKISAASDRVDDPTRYRNNEDVPGEGFEFAFTIGEPESNLPVTADSWIHPVYPVFGRSLFPANDDVAERAGKDEPAPVLKPLQALLIEEREEARPISRTASSSGSSEADDLEGVPAGTYCAWTPATSSAAASSPVVRWKKSASTGSLLWWRLRDLMKRSHSDGKEKFVFLVVPEKKAAMAIEKPGVKSEQKKKNKNVKMPVKNGSKKDKRDVSAAHAMFYGNAGQSAAGAGRRSFLPYRQDLIGLFASSRSYHPM